jgi:hypothetical protein
MTDAKEAPTMFDYKKSIPEKVASFLPPLLLSFLLTAPMAYAQGPGGAGNGSGNGGGASGGRSQSYIPPGKTTPDNTSWVAITVWGLVDIGLGAFAALFLWDAVGGAKQVSGAIGNEKRLKDGEVSRGFAKLAIGAVFCVACLVGFGTLINHVINDTGIFSVISYTDFLE